MIRHGCQSQIIATVSVVLCQGVMKDASVCIKIYLGYGLFLLPAGLINAFLLLWKGPLVYPELLFAGFASNQIHTLHEFGY